MRAIVTAEQNQRDPILAYVEVLRDTFVENPLNMDLIKSEDEEWSNTTQLVARYLLSTEKHLKALVDYCYDRSKEETTKALRKFVQGNIKTIEETARNNKHVTDKKLAKLDEHRVN